jgi:hypothetical protein
MDHVIKMYWGMEKKYHTLQTLAFLKADRIINVYNATVAENL